MPRIPTYQPGQVAPVQTTDARLRAADSGAGQIIGRAVSGLGQAVGEFAVNQDHVNALNDDTQARKAALDFAGKATAIRQQFTALQGANARQAQGETEKQLAALRDQQLGSAANPRMRRLMEERIGSLYADASSSIAEHAIQQAQVERGGALAGEATMCADQAASEQDPAKRTAYIGQALTATNNLLDFKGVSDPQARAFALRQTTSGIHRNVMDHELASADPHVEFIQTYLAAHRDEMLSSDIEAIEKDLQAPMQARQADSDFIRASGGAIPQSAPSGSPAVPGVDRGQMIHVTGSSESGNRDYDANGRVITSPAGARYRMQVMPATARDPGHGIKPAANDSAAEWNRVGEQLITALQRKYNDPAKAWAAYNWGEGRVDKAVAQHGAAWLSAAPKETRDYVAKNVAQIDDQGHSTERPQEWDKDKVYNQIDALADKEGWTFERRERAKKRADAVIQRDEELKGRAERAADEEAISIVSQLGGGFTSINQIPRKVRDSLSPSALARYTDQARSNAAPKEVKPNGPAAMTLNQMKVLEPDKFKTLNLGEFLGKVSNAEMDTLLTEQAKLRAQTTGAWSPSSGITSALTYGKNISGQKFKPEEEAAVVQIMDADARALHAAGKTDDQIDWNQLYRHATRKVATVNRGWIYDTAGAKPIYQLGTDAMPADWRKATTEKFKREMRREPSDDELLTLFRTTYRFREPR